MTTTRRSTRKFSPVAALVLLASLPFTACLADSDDFQAMTGLWKTQSRSVHNGHPGKPTVKWHCFYEEGDPWAEFADLAVPGAHCTRGDEQRTDTTLAWTLTCPGHAPKSLTGRVEFDSPEHYTASIATSDHHELMRVEGLRRAACTDPSD